MQLSTFATDDARTAYLQTLRARVTEWAKEAQSTERSFALQGMLIALPDGCLGLSVPKALVRGLFDAIHEPGVEMPPMKSSRAFFTVMTSEDVKKAGGIDKITERGHSYGYSLGRLESFQPMKHSSQYEKFWTVAISSPDLEKIRTSYGLDRLPDDHTFHLVVAVRKKSVFRPGQSTVKSSSVKAAADLASVVVPPTKVQKDRVRIVAPMNDGNYIIELLDNPKFPHNIGKMRFPGGGVDEGETHLQAAIRELREETGYDAKPEQLRYIGPDHRPDYSHEHYFELLNHDLQPGSREDAASPGTKVTYIAGKPEGDMWVGPDMKQMMTKKASDFSVKKLQKFMKTLEPLAPDFGGVWVNESEKKLHIVSSDSDDEPEVQAWISAMKKEYDGYEVTAESETGPKGSHDGGWVRVSYKNVYTPQEKTASVPLSQAEIERRLAANAANKKQWADNVGRQATALQTPKSRTPLILGAAALSTAGLVLLGKHLLRKRDEDVTKDEARDALVKASHVKLPGILQRFVKRAVGEVPPEYDPGLLYEKLPPKLPAPQAIADRLNALEASTQALSDMYTRGGYDHAKAQVLYDANARELMLAREHVGAYVNHPNPPPELQQLALRCLHVEQAHRTNGHYISLMEVNKPAPAVEQKVPTIVSTPTQSAAVATPEEDLTPRKQRHELVKEQKVMPDHHQKTVWGDQAQPLTDRPKYIEGTPEYEEIQKRLRDAEARAKQTAPKPPPVPSILDKQIEVTPEPVEEPKPVEKVAPTTKPTETKGKTGPEGATESKSPAKTPPGAVRPGMGRWGTSALIGGSLLAGLGGYAALTPRKKKPLLEEEKAAADKPLRQRAEIYAIDSKGHVLLGKHPGTGHLMAFGGGVDKGETPAQAAARELTEETGYIVRGVRKLPVPKLTVKWNDTDAELTAKAKARRRHYSGDVTSYFIGNIVGKTKPKDPSKAKDIAFRPLPTFLAALRKSDSNEYADKHKANVPAILKLIDKPMRKDAGLRELFAAGLMALGQVGAGNLPTGVDANDEPPAERRVADVKGRQATAAGGSPPATSVPIPASPGKQNAPPKPPSSIPLPRRKPKLTLPILRR